MTAKTGLIPGPTESLSNAILPYWAPAVKPHAAVILKGC